MSYARANTGHLANRAQIASHGSFQRPTGALRSAQDTQCVPEHPTLQQTPRRGLLVNRPTSRSGPCWGLSLCGLLSQTFPGECGEQQCVPCVAPYASITPESDTQSRSASLYTTHLLASTFDVSAVLDKIECKIMAIGPLSDT